MGGGDRAGAMLAYVSREGNLRLENERGEKLQQSGDVAKVLAEWEPLMENRAHSKDIASFTMQLEGDFADLSDLELRELGRQTFAGLTATRTEDGEDRHSFAFGMERQSDSTATMTGLMVLRSSEGTRRTPDAKGEDMLARTIGSMKGRLAAEGSNFRFTGYGNGVEYGTHKLRDLVERFDGQVTTDRGRAVAGHKQAGDLLQHEWRKELHSRVPRDVMHVILSAKAGTDAPAFEAAVRGFLAEQFGEQGHRYVFAMHDPATDPKTAGDGGKRPHIHAHAIITAKTDHGDRARNSPATFREWREKLAEHARAHGIKMEMTDRRDIASAPAYTRTQVRPVSRQGRTEHEGTSRPAHARYTAKREGLRVYAVSPRSQQYRTEAVRTWGALALSADDSVVQFARAQIEQIQGVQGKVEPLVQMQAQAEASPAFTQNMVALQAIISEDGRMADAEERQIQTRPQFETYEKSVNAAIFKAEREITDPNERAALDDLTTLVRELVGAKRDVVETAAELAEHAELRAQGVDVDRAYQEYDAAVEKHGAETVDAGNALLTNMNRAQDAWIEAGEPTDPDHPAAAVYSSELTAVVNGAREGNGYLAEIVRENEALREADRELNEERAGEREDESADPRKDADDKASANVGSPPAVVGDQENPEPQYADDELQDDREANDNARRLHEHQMRVDGANKAADKGKTEQEARRDQPSSDPARQQVPRQNEQQRERDDDFER